MALNPNLTEDQLKAIEVAMSDYDESAHDGDALDKLISSLLDINVQVKR